MVIVVIIAAVGFSIPTLVKLATPKQKEVMTEVTTLSQLEEPEVKQEEFKKVEPVAPPPALKSSIKFTAPVIKKDEEVRDDEEIKSQEELTQTKVAISIADVKGNDELNGKDIAELKEVITKAPEAEEKPYTSRRFERTDFRRLSVLEDRLPLGVQAAASGSPDWRSTAVSYRVPFLHRRFFRHNRSEPDYNIPLIFPPNQL